MDKIITIFGDITEQTTQDFVEESASLCESDTLTVCISSFGGLLDEGWKIYNHIKQLQDRGVYTIVLVDKYCMSSAVLPLLAVPVNRRFAREYSLILIHQPYFALQEGANLKADQLTAMADDLNKSIAELQLVYADAFGKANAKQIDVLMTQEQPICADLAEKLGIIGSVVRQKLNHHVFTSAKAQYTTTTAEGKINKAKIEHNNMHKKVSIVDRLINALSSVKLNLVVSTGEGIDIVVPSKEDNEDLAVGDKVDGTPDGVYTVDNMIVTIEGGAIADIQKDGEEKEEQPEEQPEEPSAEPSVEDACKKEKKNEVDEESIVNEEAAPEAPEAQSAPEVTIAQFNELADRVAKLEAAVSDLSANSSSLEAMDEKLKSFGNIFKELKNAVIADPAKQSETKDYAYYKAKGVF